MFCYKKSKRKMPAIKATCEYPFKKMQKRRLHTFNACKQLMFATIVYHT